MRAIAITLTTLVHPLLLPFYALFILFNSGTVFSFIPADSQYIFYGVTFVGLLLFPLMMIPILRSFKFTDNYITKYSSERIFPILIFIISLFILFYVTRNVPYSFIVRQLYLIMIILLSGYMLMSIRCNICLRMTGLGCLCSLVYIIGIKYLGDVFVLLTLLIILSGLVGFSRLYLKHHTPIQIYTGFIYGSTFMFLVLS